VSTRLQGVDTLFLHQQTDDYRVAVLRDGERILQALLELKETSAGPRPGRFRLKRDSTETPRDPSEFVEIARRASRIRISEQTDLEKRAQLKEMLSGYQLEASTVRTCRYCALEGSYSPLSQDSAISAGDEELCPDCAIRELDSELAYRGTFDSAASSRLEELMLSTQDLDRITDLLSGGLDPELTKFDEISATTDDIELVPTRSLGVQSELQGLLEERFDTLLPVQSLAVEGGLLEGDDQLVVSATATGKTLIGEIAGLDRMLRDEGSMLFLVPLVALANQTYRDFQDAYGHLGDVTLRVGSSRIRGDGERFEPGADLIVGTYEGIDHALRTGKNLGSIGTVVIDEVHTLQETERGHRLDGLIARLKQYCEHHPEGETQWIYLSATVGNPGWLAQQLEATLVEFEERPVPIDRHVTFADGAEKPRIENKLVSRAFDSKSSLGYRGQTIIFTNSRRRCQEIARTLDYDAAAYHAGLDTSKRARVEAQFADQEIAAVVTTAALAAGVDFPASQVIFDTLAMGIEWLSVQEFHQMLGRAGRPDYHDRGTVYLLVEPDCSYHSSMERSEDEVAFTLLNDEMEHVETRYDESSAIEETLANIVVGGAATKRLNERMIGEIPTRQALARLIEYEFIEGLEPTPLGRAITRHFLDPDDAFRILEGIRNEKAPYDIVATLELVEDDS